LSAADSTIDCGNASANPIVLAPATAPAQSPSGVLEPTEAGATPLAAFAALIA
jgi:hypothetical protein